MGDTALPIVTVATSKLRVGDTALPLGLVAACTAQGEVAVAKKGVLTDMLQ